MASTCAVQHEQAASLLDSLNASDEADKDWEFNAPKFKDFTIDSDDDDITHAESWFCDANVPESAPSQIPSEALYIEDENSGSKTEETTQVSIPPSVDDVPKSAERTLPPFDDPSSERYLTTPQAAESQTPKIQISAERMKARDNSPDSTAEDGSNRANTSGAHTGPPPTQQVHDKIGPILNLFIEGVGQVSEQRSPFLLWQQALPNRNLVSSWGSSKPVRISQSISDYYAPRRKIEQNNFPPPLPAWDGQLKLRKTKFSEEKTTPSPNADDEKENSPILSVRRIIEKKNQKIENEKRNQSNDQRRVPKASSRVLVSKDLSAVRMENGSKSVERKSENNSPSSPSLEMKARSSMEEIPRRKEDRPRTQSAEREVKSKFTSVSGEKKKPGVDSGQVGPERKQQPSHSFARCPQKLPNKGESTKQSMKKPPKKAWPARRDGSHLNKPSQKKEELTKKNGIAANKKLSLTEPHTPHLQTMKRYQANFKPLVPSEDMEIERIKREIKEEHEKRKVQALDYQKVLYNSKPAKPVHSDKALTQPIEFTFNTDKRLGVPKNTGEPVMTAAELVQKMEMLGPGKGISIDKPLRKSTSLTDIVEFTLETQSRSRPVNMLSAEERESEFMKQIPKFKARPLNKKVIESCGQVGVPRIKSREVTKVEEFHFLTDKRVHSQDRSDNCNTNSHDNPKRHSFSGTRGPTKPVGFRLLTDQRASTTVRPTLEELRKYKEDEEEKHLKINFQARPIPADHTPLCKKPLPRRASIDIKPFNLVTEKRGEAKRQSLDAKVAQERVREGRLRIKKAKPLPPSHRHPQIDNSIESRRNHTNPKPFNLASLSRHEHSVEEMKQNIALHEAEMRSSRQFTARSFKNSDSYWRPALSGKHSEPDNVQLNSDTRADKRKEYEQRRKIEEKARLDTEKLVKKEEESKLKEEIKALRKSIQFKARKMPAFYGQAEKARENLEVKQGE